MLICHALSGHHHAAGYHSADDRKPGWWDSCIGPGQRVPSVRYASQTYGVSPSTVFQAYYLLERRGLIRAKPRSGYFVNTHAPSPFSEPEVSSHPTESTQVDVSDLVFSVLDSIKDPHTVPFGSAFPSPMLFPLQRLARSMAIAAQCQPGKNPARPVGRARPALSGNRRPGG